MSPMAPTVAFHELDVTMGPSCEDTPCWRALELADRLEQSARKLARLAASLTDAQWQIRVPRDGRTIGVLVHHIASVFPLEVQLAQTTAAGVPVSVILDEINDLHAKHAGMFGTVPKEAALDLLRRNSATAATAIRAMSEEQLGRVAPVSEHRNTPFTCQSVLEDHAVRQLYFHLARIQIALRAHDEALERLKRQLVS